MRGLEKESVLIVLSTDNIEANEQAISSITLSLTASMVSMFFSGGRQFFFKIAQRQFAKVDVFDIKASPCGKKGKYN
jgi:hypothetical protein